MNCTEYVTRFKDWKVARVDMDLADGEDPRGALERRFPRSCRLMGGRAMVLNPFKREADAVFAEGEDDGLAEWLSEGRVPRTICVRRRTDGEVDGFTVPVGEDVPDMEALGRFFPLSAPKIDEGMVLPRDTDPEDVGWPSGHDPDVDEYMADWLDGYTAVMAACVGRMWRYTLIRSSGHDHDVEDALKDVTSGRGDDLVRKAMDKGCDSVWILVGGE